MEKIIHGSTNVFADIGLPDATERQAKLKLALAINDTITARRGWLAAPGSARQPLFRERLAVNLATSAEIAAQDVHVDSLIPIGLRSRYAARGRYSWQEQAQLEFNNWLVRRYKVSIERVRVMQCSRWQLLLLQRSGRAATWCRGPL